MSVVRASIDIAAPRERVFEAILDPHRLQDWVTIHRRLDAADSGPPHQGYAMKQTLALRGAPFHVSWTLTEHDPPARATWEGRGPVHSYARTSYALSALPDGGTRFDYENEFRAPGGILGSVASRALMGGLPEREALHSLEKLKRLLKS